MTIFTGQTVEAAIEQGLASLGLSRSQAAIQVISKEKKGFLGFGKKLAQVSVEPLAQTDEPVVTPVVEETVPSQPDVVVEEQVVSTTPAPVEESFEEFVAKEFETVKHDPEEVTKDVLAYLEKIIYEMDIEATVTAQQSRRHITFQIETTEPGRMIGYHGKVLKSLQLLAQNFLHDRYSRGFSISLNVNDYMEHRTGTLIEVATRMAHKVLETGETCQLDPMTNSERKVIHKTVSRIPGVESYSEGDDPNRYVVIVSRDRY